jgi:hypothetical protein
MHSFNVVNPSRISQRLALGSIVFIMAALSGLNLVLAKRDVTPNAVPEPIEIRSRPFDFNRLDVAQQRFGELEWRGGLILTSPNRAFGGFSGISLSPDGKQLLAISDRGGWMSAQLDYENGRLAKIDKARIGAILDSSGEVIKGVWENDSESLVALKQNPGLEGRYLIGFEGKRQRIEEFVFEDGKFSAPLRQRAIPHQLDGMEDNKGLEGAAILRGGPYKGAPVLFAEKKLNKNGDHTGALTVKGHDHPLFLRRPDTYDITALEGLEDGSLLVLERSFIRKSLKLGIRVRLIPADEIKPGALLEGRVLLDADRKYAIDNFEAMAVSKGPAGETIITLMSDDNFNFFQTTMLAQFALMAD